MAAGERTELPTPRRLAEARKRGEVAKSQDLAHVASAAIALLLLGVALGAAGRRMTALARECLAASPVVSGDPAAAADLLGQALTEAFWIGAPFLLTPALAGALVLALQVRGLFAVQRLAPRAEHLNPVRGIQRLGARRGWIELLKSALLCIALAGLAAVSLDGLLGTLLRLPEADVRAIPLVLARLLTTFALYALLLAAAVALADYFYQRWQHLRDLRMSKADWKRDHRDDQGDPLIKAARQQRWQELQQQRMFAAVQTQADFLVRNPTHLVCAVCYDPATPGAPPRLIGKGKGWVAQRLRAIARAAHIPEIRNVPVARALYQLELDEPIPPELYVAVGEILRWVEAEAAARGQTVRWRRAAEEEATHSAPTRSPS